MKRLLILFVLGTALLLSACSNADISAAVSGKTFMWEKEGFGGNFTLRLKDDGTYTYYEGYLSSYIGMGKWTLQDSVVTLYETSGDNKVFRFATDGDDLLFVADGSSEFLYVTVADGDRFILTDGS